VRSSCARSVERDVFVAVADGRPVGFAAVVLNAFRGIARLLMNRSTEHMRAKGIDIAAVGTEPTRGTALPVVSTNRSATRRYPACGT